MKQRTVKNAMFNEVIHFDTMLFDRPWKQDKKMEEIAKNIDGMVDVFEKHGIEDYDLWVFLTYRQGKMRSKKSEIKKLRPKTLVNAIADGFEIPDDATMVEIEIVPVFSKNYERKVGDDCLYKVKFGLGKGEELTIDQLKRRYGLTPQDNLYSVQDMRENSKILKFYNRKKREKSNHVEKESPLSL